MTFRALFKRRTNVKYREFALRTLITAFGLSITTILLRKYNLIVFLPQNTQKVMEKKLELKRYRFKYAYQVI